MTDKKYNIRAGENKGYHTARLGEEIIGVFWGATGYDRALQHVKDVKEARLFRRGPDVKETI